MIKATGGSCRTFEELYRKWNDRAALKPRRDERPIAVKDYQRIINYLEAHRGKWFSAADLVKAIGVLSSAASDFASKHPELCEKRYFLKKDGKQVRRFVEVRSR